MTGKTKTNVQIDGRNFTVMRMVLKYIHSLAAYVDKNKEMVNKNNKLSSSMAAILLALYY